MNPETILQAVFASLPEIIVLAAACFLLLADLVLGQKRTHIIAYLAIAAVLAASVASLSMGAISQPVYSGMFIADGFAIFFKMLFYLATILVVLFSINYLKIEGVFQAEYFVFLLFALSGMMIMASGIDLLSIYIGLELMALSSYVLSGFFRHDLRSNEAAMKYVILGALSSGILLYGISLIYGLTGTTQLPELAATLHEIETFDSALVLAVLMLVGGFAFKVAAVPFHMWVPDVYEGAPTPITAFLSVGPKAAGFAVILRIFLDGLAGTTEIWLAVVAIIAVASLILGSVVALVQTNIKRMLAYSSIAHAGFALLGLVAGGANGIASVMYYLLIYTLMSLGAFAVIIIMRQGDVSGEQIEDYAGLAKAHPVLALLMLIFLFALAGIPPTAGFFAKFYIFIALIEQGYIALAVIAVLFSVVAAFFYIRIIMLMYMREPDHEFNLVLTPPLRVVLAITGAGIVLIGVMPAWGLEWAQSAVF
jgi:NADH-quinone oxidoreductase subunit N